MSLDDIANYFVYFIMGVMLLTFAVFVGGAIYYGIYNAPYAGELNTYCKSQGYTDSTSDTIIIGSLKDSSSLRCIGYNFSRDKGNVSYYYYVKPSEVFK